MTKKFKFSASHRLFIDSLGDEENFNIFDKCSNPNGHGHDYVVEVGLTGAIDDENGMVYNHDEFDLIVSPVIDDLNYKWIDKEIDFFKENQSTIENIGQYLWEKLKGKFENKLNYLRIRENPRSYFEYYERNSICR